MICFCIIFELKFSTFAIQIFLLAALLWAMEGLAKVSDRNNGGGNPKRNGFSLVNAFFSHTCTGDDGSVFAPCGDRIVRIDPASGSVIDSTVSFCSNPDLFQLRLSATQNNLVFATNGENKLALFYADLNGNIVKCGIISSRLTMVETSNLCEGCYFLQVVDQGIKIF